VSCRCGTAKPDGPEYPRRAWLRDRRASGVSEFRSFNNGTSKRVLDLLETMYLRLRKIVVQRVTVVKFGMYYGGCNDTGCFGIKMQRS